MKKTRGFKIQMMMNKKGQDYIIGIVILVLVVVGLIAGYLVLFKVEEVAA